MANEAKVTLRADDQYQTQLRRFKAQLGEVAGGMSFTTSATGRWAAGLRNLETQQRRNNDLVVNGITQGATWTSGIGKAGNALNNLAGNLIGANNQVTNIAEGLLGAFGGGGVVTAAAIGVTALAGAFLYLTKTTREAQKAYDTYMEALRKDTPFAIVGSQLEAVREKVADLEALQAPGKEHSFAIAGGQRRLDALRAELAAIVIQEQSLFAGFGVQREETGKKFAEKAAEEAERRKRTQEKIEQEEAERRKRQNLSVDEFLKYRGAQDTVSLPGEGRLDARVAAGQLLPTEDDSWWRDWQTLADAISPVTVELDKLGLSAERMRAAFVETLAASIASAKSFGDATTKAVGGALKATARLLGQEQFAKAAAKFAEGIWPPNPLALLSGLKHLAAGTLFMALAGGGGGHGGGGGGGGGSPSVTGSSFDRSQREAGRGVETLRIKADEGTLLDPNGPGFARIVAKAIEAGRYARLIELDFT